MMNTILNLGLNDEATEGLAKATKNERFAYDALSPPDQHVRRRRHGAAPTSSSKLPL
ncbi:hypothetical protein [Rhodopirellula europaea]|uniref:hypothetical protein n=1 Tax=Rhodopirellula europaea TaxID=1263866 RepID=UPI003D299097